MNFIEPFKNFKYHGIFVEAYTNKEGEIKKKVIEPTQKEYENKKHYIKPIFGNNPNGIAINLEEYSCIDVDIPNNCSILEQLLKDCNFIVKTRKGYHFYFNKEDQLERIKFCEIADINLKQLYFVPKFYHRYSKML
jgi:hypothetical protein